MGVYAQYPTGIPNGGFGVTPAQPGGPLNGGAGMATILGSMPSPTAPTTGAPSNYASQWMLPTTPAGGFSAGMMWNGSPLSAADAMTLNRVASEPTNQTWLAGTNGTANPMAAAMQGMGVPTTNGAGGVGYTTAGTPVGASYSGTGNANLSSLPPGYANLGTQQVNPNAVPTLGSIANGVGANGGIPGANMNIPAAPGNPYTLNIGSYLNPLMQYAMQQGTNSIMNSQASQGLLNSGDTLKQLYGYGLGLGANNFNSAAGIAAGQQGFGAGLDQYDQQFAYNAQNNDRNFALQALLGEGNLGLGGATQQSWNDRILAQLLSSNLGSLGQAQGAGAIGGSNATNNAIMQLLQQYYGMNALNGLTGGTGGG